MEPPTRQGISSKRLRRSTARILNMDSRRWSGRETARGRGTPLAGARATNSRSRRSTESLVDGAFAERWDRNLERHEPNEYPRIRLEPRARFTTGGRVRRHRRDEHPPLSREHARGRTAAPRDHASISPIDIAGARTPYDRRRTRAETTRRNGSIPTDAKGADAIARAPRALSLIHI